MENLAHNQSTRPNMNYSTFRQYQTTNKVSLLRFVPILFLAVVISGIMSFVLLFADMFYYLFIIMPILIGLPVLGMVYLVIRIGRCRNTIVGTIIGVLLILQFYLGFWGLGYMAFVGYNGWEEGTQILISETGSSGVWGYFKYRCQTNIIEDTNMPSSPDDQSDSFDMYSSYAFYGIELFALLFLGYKSSNSLSRRVFYEKQKKWARHKSIRFLPADFDKLVQAVYEQDWTAIDDMTKFSKFGNQQTSYAELVIEYCKNNPFEPVYLTIKGAGLKKVAQENNITGKGLLEKTFIKQLEIPGSAIHELQRVLPGLKLLPATVPDPVEISTSAMPTSAGGFVNAEHPETLPFNNLSKSAIGENKDFRQDAVDESVKMAGYNKSAASLTNANLSACFPVEPEDCIAVKKIAFFPLVFSVMAIISIFGGLGIALWGSEQSLSGTDDIAPMGYVLITIGICIFLSSFFFLFFSKPMHIRRMKKLFLERRGALFDRLTTLKMFASNIEDGKTYHAFKFTPEDVGLVCLDAERHKLLIEGCSHRYLICGKDVMQIESVQNASANVVLISYQIGSVKLSLALESESLKKAFLNQIIFGLFKGRTSHNFVDELKEILGIKERL